MLAADARYEYSTLLPLQNSDEIQSRIWSADEVGSMREEECKGDADRADYAFCRQAENGDLRFNVRCMGRGVLIMALGMTEGACAKDLWELLTVDVWVGLD